MKLKVISKKQKWIIGGTIVLFLLLALSGSASNNSNISMEEIMRTSFLGTRNERGIRNNNPLNIKYSTREYFGKILYANNTDEGKMHEQFESLVFGIAAAIQHMTQRYIKREGWTVQDCSVPRKSMTSPFDTIRKIANVWAPKACDPSPKMPAGNNPDEYIAYIVRKTGFNPDAKISATDKETLKKLIWAMSIFENGSKYEKDILSWENWDLFFNVAWSLI